ncbi:MAG: DUF2085 domain-containing protein [Spirochaetales bacterium]|nr:DUF2085 domain-containing protein [Spirochaetales bacterium]
MIINIAVIFKTIKLLFYCFLILFLGGFIFTLFFASHPFSHFIFSLFGFLCHQDDVILCGEIKIVLPLCFRCSGTYLFLIIGSVCADIFSRRIRGHFHSMYLVLGTLPLILDGFFKITAVLKIPAVSFMTGALFGFTCGTAIMYGLNGVIQTKTPPKKIL